MKLIYDRLSSRTSRDVMRLYSTSFSLGTICFPRAIQKDICGIYGFVRLADEIVDTFLEADQSLLLEEFVADTHRAIERGISLNPVLHSFQDVVHRNAIDRSLIDAFVESMRRDLERRTHDMNSFQSYVYGSAEVVGLMCLKVFARGDSGAYDRNVKSARALGAAFQKVNFLRDVKYDYTVLRRSYFPNVDPTRVSAADKHRLEGDIEEDFSTALAGIKTLPRAAQFGVYLAYAYYQALFRKLKSTPSERMLSERIRVSGFEKFVLFFRSLFNFYAQRI